MALFCLLGNIFPSSAYLCKPSFFDSIDHAWTRLPIKSHSISPSWHTVKVRVQGSRVLCAHRCALFIPNPTFFFFLLCQNGEKHHKGHGHGFPLVWLHEKVRGGHHEMAVRPSRRPHRDRSCYTNPEMAGAENIPGTHSPEPGRFPWASCDLILSLIGLNACSKACTEYSNSLG